MQLTDIAAFITAISALLGAVAWPSIIIASAILTYKNRKIIIENLNVLTADRTLSKLAIGPSGISAELVEKATKAVVESVERSQRSALDIGEVKQINRSAQAAVQVVNQPRAVSQLKFRILWIDDHPENNIGLQYAFQMLGMIVINIDTNSSIEQAFYVSNGFNVVITDMHRDGIANRSIENPLAGEETVNAIRDKHPGVPVVIFANQYARKHANDTFISPVVKITNSPREVFSTVADLAKMHRGIEASP